MGADLSSKLIITKPFHFKKSKCGYCNLPDSSTSFGFDSESMTVEQYDLLINDGFRRSGNFVYKPHLDDNCCKYYTIRTSMKHFKNSKEFKQILNKFNRFIGNEGNKSKEFDLDYELMKLYQCDEDEFEIRVENNAFTMEKYELFVKYQKSIHDDEDTSQKGFKRFLCTSPFTTEGKIEVKKDGSKVSFRLIEYGAVHQCYYYKKQLIAIGVLDILPSGISSVYFIYDDDYKQLDLGKLSTLVEMEITKKLGLEWYYLGYYIPNIVKMKYKKRYGGEILDIIDHEWVDFAHEQKVVDKLEHRIKQMKEKQPHISKDEFPHFIGEHPITTPLSADDYPLLFNLNEMTLLKPANHSNRYSTELSNIQRLIGNRLAAQSIVKVWDE